jgi:hypothetical protein
MTYWNFINSGTRQSLSPIPRKMALKGQSHEMFHLRFVIEQLYLGP